MNSNTVVAIIWLGPILMYNMGYAEPVLAYLIEHHEPIREVVLGFVAVGLFVAWIALEGERIRLEDEAVNKGER